MIVEKYIYELLDVNDNPLRRFRAVKGGKVVQSIATHIGGSASFTTNDRISSEIDWQRYRCRISYQREETIVPLITGRVKVTSAIYPKDRVVRQLALLDNTEKLDIPFPEQYGIGPDVSITQEIENIANNMGIPIRISVVPSDKLTRAAKLYDITATRLEVINDLLDQIGYFSAYAAGDGLIICEPYTEPSARPVAYEFSPEAGMYLPGIQYETNAADVPNWYKCVAVAVGDETPEIAIAVDDDPGSPWSTITRGIIVPKVDTEVSENGNLQEIADRRLKTSQAAYEKITITGTYSDITLNEIVLVDDPTAGRWRGVCQRIEQTLTNGGGVEYTIRILR